MMISGIWTEVITKEWIDLIFIFYHCIFASRLSNWEQQIMPIIGGVFATEVDTSLKSTPKSNV